MPAFVADVGGMRAVLWQRSAVAPFLAEFRSPPRTALNLGRPRNLAVAAGGHERGRQLEKESRSISAS